MQTHTRRHRTEQFIALRYRLALLLCVLWAVRPDLTHGILGVGDIVEDPFNLIQNTMTASNSFEELVKLQDQLKQQLFQIQQDAQHLVALPVSLAQQIQGVMNQYAQALATVKGLSYQVGTLQGQWNSLYGGGSAGSLPQKAAALASALQNAGSDAASMQSIYGQLSSQAQQVQLLLAASQAAPGSRATQQATNQLLGTLAEQQQMLAQIQATGWRAQTMAIEQDNVANQAAQQNAQRWMQGFSDVQPRAPGEGQGMALPK